MKILITILLLHTTFFVFAQQSPNIKFGKIAPADLEKKIYAIDSSANAVVISDIGESQIEGNNKGWFSIIHKRFRRVHILKKSAYSVADIKIPLYSVGNANEELYSIKAVTYNLENGKVVESKLDKSGIFTDKMNKSLSVKKFTLPNVKEGSVIEYEYTVKSDFLRYLRSWEFQGKYPCLWSEYDVSLPDFLGYVTMKKGYLAFTLNKSEDRSVNFNLSESKGAGPSEHYNFTSNVTEHRWAIKDVPELKEESFTSTLDNYVTGIDFQLSEYRQPLTPRQIMHSWPEATKELLEDDDFGKSLSSGNGSLSAEVSSATAGAASPLEKAKHIFEYVRENMSCTGHSALYISQSLKEVLKAKKGNVSEINLLLTAMLRHANIEADPVMLSTKDHGFTYAIYPLMSQYNYVVSKVTIDGKEYYLDASHARLGFGKLPVDCYNGTARQINSMANAVDLLSDPLMEKKVTSVLVYNDEKGKWNGNVNQTLGYYESYQIRDKIKEHGEEELVKDMKKAYNNELVIEKPSFDSLNRYDDPVKIKYGFTMNNNKEDIIYLNPMFAEGQKENPFKSAELLYPVEMPYASDETFLLTMDVPVGYVVDELPKPVRVKLNQEGDGEFEYLISNSANTISLRSRLKFNRANFTPDEYGLLREFFNLVVNKHNEQIVFKKKK